MPLRAAHPTRQGHLRPSLVPCSVALYRKPLRPRRFDSTSSIPPPTTGFMRTVDARTGEERSPLLGLGILPGAFRFLVARCSIDFRRYRFTSNEAAPEKPLRVLGLSKSVTEA